MNTRDDVIKALGGLNRADRDWIIQRLPPATRFALLLGTQDKPNDKQATVTATLSDGKSDGVAKATPSAVAAVLEREPAWIAHAVLSVERPWNAEIRAALSQPLSRQLSMLDRESVTYSTALRQSIERRLADAATTVAIENASSPFRQMLSRIGVRVSSARMNRGMQT